MTWSRVEATLSRSSADGVVLLAPGADDAVVLNATAAAVWRQLDRPRTTAALVAGLATSHGVPEATVASDLPGFLAQLRAIGVVRRDP